MCFSSSKSSAKTDTTTTTRDERVAADNGSAVFSFKDIGATEGGSLNFSVEDVSAEIFAQVFDFAKGVGQGAVDFAERTQSSFQEAASSAATQDTTEIFRQLINIGGLVAVAFVAFQIWGK